MISCVRGIENMDLKGFSVLSFRDLNIRGMMDLQDLVHFSSQRGEEICEGEVFIYFDIPP